MEMARQLGLPSTRTAPSEMITKDSFSPVKRHEMWSLVTCRFQREQDSSWSGLIFFDRSERMNFLKAEKKGRAGIVERFVVEGRTH